jgi:hypothetical protein
MMVALVCLGCMAIMPGPAAAESRTFYLSHEAAEGLPELLDELVREGSPWVKPLSPHWDGLREHVQVKRDTNAIQATGEPEALEALAQVIKALDVPRPQVTLKYQQIRLADPQDLTGRPAGPPLAAALASNGAGGLPAVCATGDWQPAVAALVKAGKAKVLQEGGVAAVSGGWGTVYLGDPEAPKPSFCFQARPVVTEDGAVWLSLAYGVLKRKGGEAKPPAGQPGAQPAGEVCVNCGPGVGEMLLQPEIILSARLAGGMSLLVSGLRWHVEGGESLSGPQDECVVVTAQVEPASGAP